VTPIPPIPNGWSVISASGDGNPELQGGGILWTGKLPESPVRVQYVVSIPLWEYGARSVDGEFGYHKAGESNARKGHPVPETLLMAPQDLDEDGLADGWEAHCASDSGDMSAGADTDGDRLNSLQEYIAGTDPTNRLSVLQIKGLRHGADGEVTVWWDSAMGRFYVVDQSTGPMHGFSALATNIMATPPTNVHTNRPAGTPPRFYRIRIDQ